MQATARTAQTAHGRTVAMIERTPSGRLVQCPPLRILEERQGLGAFGRSGRSFVVPCRYACIAVGSLIDREGGQAHGPLLAR